MSKGTVNAPGAYRYDLEQVKQVANNAQTTAEEAMRIAEEAKQSGGGSGGDQQITEEVIQTAEEAKQTAEEAKEIAEEAKQTAEEAKEIASNNGGNSGGTAPGSVVHTATIGTSWTEDTATGAKYQTVSISGVTADMTAKVDTINTHDRTSAGYALHVEEQNQFLEYITNGDAETVDGGIKFYIYGDANTVAIPIVVEVG